MWCCIDCGKEFDSTPAFKEHANVLGASKRGRPGGGSSGAEVGAACSGSYTKTQRTTTTGNTPAVHDPLGAACLNYGPMRVHPGSIAHSGSAAGVGRRTSGDLETHREYCKPRRWAGLFARRKDRDTNVLSSDQD